MSFDWTGGTGDCHAVCPTISRKALRMLVLMGKTNHSNMMLVTGSMSLDVLNSISGYLKPTCRGEHGLPFHVEISRVTWVSV